MRFLKPHSVSTSYLLYWCNTKHIQFFLSCQIPNEIFVQCKTSTKGFQTNESDWCWLPDYSRCLHPNQPSPEQSLGEWYTHYIAICSSFKLTQDSSRCLFESDNKKWMWQGLWYARKSVKNRHLCKYMYEWMWRTEIKAKAKKCKRPKARKTKTQEYIYIYISSCIHNTHTLYLCICVLCISEVFEEIKIYRISNDDKG